MDDLRHSRLGCPVYLRAALENLEEQNLITPRMKESAMPPLTHDLSLSIRHWINVAPPVHYIAIQELMNFCTWFPCIRIYMHSSLIHLTQ